MNKLHLSYTQVEHLVQTIIRDIEKSPWRPDYIVGLTRGGLLPANLISQYLDTKMYSLDVALRDHADSDMGPESNCWMSEDAMAGKKILVVDDINDSGATLDWIVNDWKTSCRPDSPEWKTAIGGNVRIATLANNISSDFKEISYFGMELDKEVEDLWIVFPWEKWWEAKPE